MQAEIAWQLKPAFNAYLKQIDSTTAQAKRKVAEEVAAVLSPLHLSIRCPITNQNCKLHVNPGSEKNRNPHGGFELRPKGADSPTISRANLSDLLPLDLMPAQPRREPLAEWRHRIKKQPAEGSKKSK